MLKKSKSMIVDMEKAHEVPSHLWRLANKSCGSQNKLHEEESHPSCSYLQSTIA